MFFEATVEKHTYVGDIRISLYLHCGYGKSLKIVLLEEKWLSSFLSIMAVPTLEN